MATSGSKSVSVTKWDTLKFSWWINDGDQSIANNTTLVRWKLELIAGSYGYINSSVQKPWTVTIDGKKHEGKVTVGIANNATKKLAEGTTTVTHASNGSKTFSYSFSQSFTGITFSGESLGVVSGSGSGTLPTIARASQPSCITWPEHTQNVGSFGDEISIHMNRKDSSFTHTVRYQFGEQKGQIATGVGTGTTWVIPLTLMNLIPNSTSGSGTIYVDTYNGTTLVGTKSCGFTATVPASVKPSCSFTLEDITGIDDIYGSPVKGLSKIKVKVTAKTAYSSPIVSCVITANNQQFNGEEATTGVLKWSGDSVVTATVKDGRGRTGTVSYTMDVQAYSAPTISKLTVHRCDSDGTLNEQGEFVKVTFSAKVGQINGKGSASYTLEYKKSTATTYTAVDLPYDNKFTLTDATYIFAADSGSSYDVRLTAEDDHNTAVATTSASTGFVLMHFHKKGTGIGIGKVSEKENTLEIALDTEINGSMIQRGNRYAFSSPGVASQDGFVHMANITIVAENADTPMTFVFTQRNQTAPMTVHVQLRNPTMTAGSACTVTYEGANYGAFLTQAGKYVWDLYVQKVSQWDTVCLQDWWMSKTMESRVKVTFPGDLVDTVPTPYYRATPMIPRSILDCILPVGTIIQRYDHADPNTMYPGTTWVRITNRFLWACDAEGDIGVTSGEKTHKLTVNELPAHSHGAVYSGNVSGTKTHAWLASGGSAMAYGAIETGGGAEHNNMPPYIHVSVWRRTA